MLGRVDGKQMKLGEILIRHGFITPPQLEEGLAMQVTHGGRVGSTLIDLGHVAVDTIARALGQQHKVPAASDEAFRAVRSNVLEAVPRDLCAKHGILPLAVESRLLHLAMRDPQHLALIHQLGGRFGVKIQPYASPELRLLYFLELLYEIPRPKRYLSAAGDGDGGWRGDLEPTVEPPVDQPRAQAGPAAKPVDDLPARPSAGGRAAGLRRAASGMYAIRGSAKTADRTPPDVDESRPSSSGTHPAIRAVPAATRGVDPHLARTGPMQPVVPGKKKRPPIAPLRTGPYRAVDLVPAAPPTAQRVPVLTPHGVPVIGQQPERTPTPAGAAPTAADEDGFELVYLDEVEREIDELDIDIDIDIGFDDDAKVASPSAGEGDPRASVADVVAEMQRAGDRETVIGQLLRPVTDGVSLNVLLLARGELGVGLAAFGTEVPRGQVRQLVVPLNTDSLLKRAVDSKTVQRGPVDPLQQMIATYLRAPAPKEACVAPVMLNSKVINLICCQSEGALTAEAEAAVALVAEQAAAAYKRLILNKRGSRP
jgi:hypothetical protein